MARLGERIPGNMEPGGCRKELVGEVVGLEEINKALELSRIFGADIGGLTDEVLRVLYPAHLAIDGLVTEARIDDDWPDDGSCRLQQHQTAIGQIRHDLHRGEVFRVFLQIQKLAQKKMRREFYFIEILFHGILNYNSPRYFFILTQISQISQIFNPSDCSESIVACDEYL